METICTDQIQNLQMLFSHFYYTKINRTNNPKADKSNVQMAHANIILLVWFCILSFGATAAS